MAASYKEVEAKSITRLPGFTDPWFVSRYGMNLYRGCEHGCLYCDGRAERYYVEGNFAQDITVKVNALIVLERELSRTRERGFVFLGGGVSDAYQPAEAKYGLARGVLELVLQRSMPVHVLTKSVLAQRDLDLLVQIKQRAQAILSCSISSVDESVREHFEPTAAPFSARFALLERAKTLGLGTGIYAMPVLPGISDQPSHLEMLYARAAEAGVDFVCTGGLTLRPGAQMDCYLAGLQRSHPQHLPGYRQLYGQRPGPGAARYRDRLESRFAQVAAEYDLPSRIPRRLFAGQVPRYVELAVLLEHRELARVRAGKGRGGLAKAGMAIQRWARERFATHRRKDYDWRAVEQEFLAAVEDGSLARLDGVSPSAYAELERLMEDEPTG